ncbi:MAG: hypothetical protein ACPHK6_09590 [Ilumatobacteraceae bacterium]
MANQITDNRTNRAVAKTTAPENETWEASGGGGSVVEDTDIFIEGTTSVAEQISTSRRVMLYDNGSTIDISDSHVYIWVNCGIVGLLDIKSNGGMTVRLTGPTSTNFVEWYVGGSDSWPSSIQGGWTMFVVDTASTPSNTGGTPPLLTAIQKIGISAVTASVMTKAADNTWVDAIWTLSDGNPGIIVEGRNGGTTDWTFADINTQLTNSAGVFVQSAGGAWKCNAPIQFGINDTTTHGFTDTNTTVLWDDQEFAASDHYGMSALGNSGGTTRVVLGNKTGTGDAATGAQGGSIQAAATGVRYYMDFDDANIDDIGFYGVTFQHAGDFQLDSAATSAISCLFIDCSSANVTDCRDFLKNKIIDANTADGVAFATTNDLADMVFNEFQFSDGHAVELTTTPAKVTAQTDKGNTYSGYGATGSNDAEYYNNTGSGLVTISVTDGGDGADYRNGTSASTTVQNTVTLTVNVSDSDGNAVQGARVRIEDDPLGTLVSDGTTNASGVFSDATYNFAGNEDVIVKVRLKGYVFFRTGGTITSDGITVPVTLVTDTVVELP